MYINTFHVLFNFFQDDSSDFIITIVSPSKQVDAQSEAETSFNRAEDEQNILHILSPDSADNTLAETKDEVRLYS